MLVFTICFHFSPRLGVGGAGSFFTSVDFCPEIELLIEYQEGRLTGTQRLVVYHHLQRCKQCQAELAMFGAIDTVPNVDAPAFFRRVVDALFQSPTLTPAPVRGGMLFYRTPQIGIYLYSIKNAGKARTWVLQGLVRTVDDQPFIACEDILLVDLDEPTTLVRHAVLGPTGTFRFSDLAASRYRLHLITPEEEILIREIALG